MTMNIKGNVGLHLACALLQRQTELVSKKSNLSAHVWTQVRCYCNDKQLRALPMYLLSRNNSKGACLDKWPNSSCTSSATLILPRFYRDSSNNNNSKYSNKHSSSYELSDAHNARSNKCSSESADDTSWDDVVIDSRIGWHEYRLEEELESSLEDKLFTDSTDNHEENEENIMCNDNDNEHKHFDEDRSLGNIIDNKNYSNRESNTENSKIYQHYSTISSDDVQIEPVKSLSKFWQEYSSEEEEERRRNKLICLVAQELQTAVEHEIRAEVERDSVDGFAAVPPLTPPYWAVHHIPGTSFFTMTRTLKQKTCKHKNKSNESEGEEVNTINDDDNDDENNSFSVPKFRSVYDEQVDKQRKRNYNNTKETQNIATEKEKNSLRLTWARDEHRYRATNKTHSNSSLPVLERNVVRSDIHLTICAPFRVLDLSLLDPDVSICEWSCFDLFVHKTPPHYDSQTSLHKSEHHYNNSNIVGKNKYKLQGQQRIWDDNECLFLRLASVNSELRIRGIQFISSSVARSINEYAFFGQSGDPYYRYLQLEYLREEQQRSASVSSQMRNAFRSSSSNKDASTPASAHVLQASRVRASEYDEPFKKHSINAKDTHRHEHIANEVTLMFPHQRSSSLHTKTLLTHCVDERGEYARSLLYHGPYITELSSELRDALMTYIMHNLKIDVFLSEYICQMQYFLEQEEYMRWLAKTGHTAELIRRVLAKDLNRSGK